MRLLLYLFLMLSLGGCLYSGAIRPFPSEVLVPHPEKTQTDLTGQELESLYSTSPDLNPDGQGVLPVFWPQSRMILITPAVAIEREKQNRIALARTEQEQQQAIDQAGKYYGTQVVFEAILLSDRPRLVDAKWYLPKGLYLMDDQGRKFYPVKINPGQARFFLETSRISHPPGSRNSGPGPSRGYPEIVFPGDAITQSTRAVTLYFAAYQKRVSFTWIFDPDFRK